MGSKRRSRRARDEWSRRDGESVPEYRYRLRLRVIRHYCGGKRIRCQCEGCRCIGEKYLPFLQLDHTKGKGASHVVNGRRLRGFDLIAWVIKNSFPKLFGIRCGNCNQSKGTRGRCALYGIRH